MFCYNCGFNINLADKFCSSCGKRKFSPLNNHSSGRGDVLGFFVRVNSFYSFFFFFFFFFGSEDFSSFLLRLKISLFL